MSEMVPVPEIRKGDKGKLDGKAVEFITTPMTSNHDKGWGHFLVRTEDGRVYRQRLPLDDEVVMTARAEQKPKTNKGMK